MTTTMVNTTSDDTRTVEIIEKAWALLPAIREGARQSEIERRVLPSTIALAEEAGLFRTMVPKRYGGLGLGTRALCEVARVLSHGDSSSAWAISFIIEHNWMICRLPMSGQERFFKDRSYVLASAPLAPTGRAVRVDGGFLVSGTWPYGSGNQNSTHSLVVCNLDDAGGNETYAFLIALDQAAINDDWHMSGMAATSSCTVTGKDIFVPEDLAIVKDLLLTPADHPGVDHEESIYRYAMMPTLLQMMTAFMLGAAERVVEIGRERLDSSKPYGRARVDRDLSRDRWARSHQDVRAAQALYYNSLAEIIRKGEAREEWSEIESGQLQLDHLSIVEFAKSAVRRILDGTGSSTFKLSDPLQRYLRDIDVMANHLAFDYDVNAEAAARYKLGLGRRDYDPFPPRQEPEPVFPTV